MNNRVNYTLVGFLVLVGLGLMVGFTYWMLKPSAKDDIKKYTIYFDESVLGLNVDAPVKYRGISVGKVDKLEINPKNADQVEVTISVVKSTPVKVTTVAKLTAQGITGLTYINLTKGQHLAKDLVCEKGEKYPIIKTEPSFFKNFENSLSDVSSQLTSTLGRTQELLGSGNQEKMAELLRHSASLMTKMDVLLDKETIYHIQSTAKNIDAFTLKLNYIMPDIHLFIENTNKWEKETSASIESIMVSYLGLDKSMDGINNAMSQGEKDFAQLNNDVVPNLNATLLDMQELMIKLDEFLEDYRNSPSDILFKSQEIKKAPGEE